MPRSPPTRAARFCQGRRQKPGALRRALGCWVAGPFVQHCRPDLKHTMGTSGRPAHLRSLVHAGTQQPVDGALGPRGRDRLAGAAALAVVDQTALIGPEGPSGQGRTVRSAVRAGLAGVRSYPVVSVRQRHDLLVCCMQSLRAMDSVLYVIPGAVAALRRRPCCDGAKRRVELNRGTRFKQRHSQVASEIDRASMA